MKTKIQEQMKLAFARFTDLGGTSDLIDILKNRIYELENAIKDHRSQHGDDKCWMDDQELYKVLGDGDLGSPEVGDQDKMLENCKRYIKNRCTGGDWLSYAELEKKIENLELEIYNKDIILKDLRNIVDYYTGKK